MSDMPGAPCRQLTTGQKCCKIKKDMHLSGWYQFLSSNAVLKKIQIFFLHIFTNARVKGILRFNRNTTKALGKTLGRDHWSPLGKFFQLSLLPIIASKNPNPDWIVLSKNLEPFIFRLWMSRLLCVLQELFVLPSIFSCLYGFPSHGFTYKFSPAFIVSAWVFINNLT